MYIVEMNDKNITEAAECYVSSWKSAHSDYFTEDYLSAFNVEKTTNILKKDDAADRITYIAYDKNNVVGFVTIDKERFEMTHLYVRPDKQRQGIGTKLMEFAVKQMTSINRVYATVLSVNRPALAFFEKYAFDFTGEQRTLKNGILELRYVKKKK